MKQQTTKNMKVIILMIGFALIGLILISNVSAIKSLCLSRGQSVPSQSIKRYTCNHDLCTICVTDTLYPTDINLCNKQGGCSILGAESTVDSEAPLLVVTSPVYNSVYGSRRIDFDISANEPFTFYWKSNSITGNIWRRVAAGLKSYKIGLNFYEGFNDITIKAMDRSGNSVEQVIQFYIDSKKPTIKKTFPSRGFSSGIFSVQFAEASPKSVILHYGNDGVGMRTASVNLSSCISLKGLYNCNVSVNVNDYNNQNLKYWFVVNDIGNHSVVSKILVLSVDTIDPVILNPNTMIKVNKTNLYFNLNISEKNFAGAYYKIISDPRAMWKTICTRLQGGLCVKKATFSKKGNYDVDIKVVDSAGNMITKSESFSII